MQREIASPQLRMRDQGEEHRYDQAEFYEHHGISGFIRIPADERAFTPTQTILDHFNLQATGHRIGGTYGLIKILEHGSFDTTTQTQILPLLDSSSLLRVEVIDAQNNLSYHELTPEHFRHSFPHIQTINDLRAAILKRYSKSLPGHAPDELLALGIARTRMRIHQ